MSFIKWINQCFKKAKKMKSLPKFKRDQFYLVKQNPKKRTGKYAHHRADRLKEVDVWWLFKNNNYHELILNVAGNVVEVALDKYDRDASLIELLRAAYKSADNETRKVIHGIAKRIKKGEAEQQSLF